MLNLINGTSNSGTQLQTELNEQKELKVQHELILEESDEFKWIVDGISRLHSLRVVIREGSARSKAIEMLGFANHPDFAPFKRLCSQSVRMLYPYAHPELQDRLSASMTRRYATIFHPRPRQSTLQSLHAYPSTTINEEPEGSNESRVSNKANRFSSQADRLRINAEQAQGISNDSRKVDRRPQQTSPDQFHQENYPKPPEKKNADTINCEWCSAVLAEETLEPRNWRYVYTYYSLVIWRALTLSCIRRHVDFDLTPYLCIADECMEAHTQFTEFDDWFNHMQGHGKRWHQEIYQVMSWICPVCEDDKKVFINPHRLLVHMQVSHSDDFTAKQCQIISSHSKRIQQRSPNECLLCYYKIEEIAPPRHLYSRKRRKEPLREMKNKRARTNLESSLKSHSLLDDLDDEGASYDEGVDNLPTPKATKAMALHVAGHLQMLMLLTIRLASIQNEGETLIEDIDSAVNDDIGDNSSRYQDLSKILDIDLQEASEEGSLRRGCDYDSDNDFPLEDTIPDSEFYNDWNHVLSCDMPEEQHKFGHKVIKSGSYQSHQRVSFISIREGSWSRSHAWNRWASLNVKGITL